MDQSIYNYRSVGSIESIMLIEELIEWYIRGRVHWESEGQMVH